jgi:uncharacterized membrane protein YagU involved in acid resistance
LQKSNLFKAIIIAGLTAGLFDITAACIHFMIASGGKSPVFIFKYIASAAFGKEKAYSGSLLMEALGLLFHFIIAMSFTAFFFFIYPKFKFLSINIFITGLAYGIFAWLVTNLVVLPLSRIHKFPSNFNASTIVGILILMFVFGLPIALFAKKYYSKS